MIGRTISHYKILEQLGEGGMGVVYKAEDTRLKRTVALKFLGPQAFDCEADRQRFVNEARVGAALDHPNICTVFEIDEWDDRLFIAVSLIEGGALDERIRAGPLDIAEAVDIALKVASGLAAAHARGITHRDIKPSNIMFTLDDRVKITDFGLARFSGDGDTPDGVISGSAAYMSPEQARAEPLDSRSDIWSLGVVLYEMLAGRLPFRGEFDTAMMYSILNEDPTPLMSLRSEVPQSLERIVSRMIHKDRDARYQSLEDVSADLFAVKRALQSPGADRQSPAVSKPSIAVLPFVDMSEKKDQEYFCDGIAEEITSALTRVEGLRVVARTSAFSFKGKNVGIPDIGRQLGVQTLLEGSVRKVGNRLRIATQLTDAIDGFDLWSQVYDREIEDIFAIQDEIRLAIVDRLKVTLLGEDRAALVKRHTVSTEAHSLYWKGRFFWNKRTEEGYRKGIEYFQQAIDKDPTYALAHVGVADCYNLLGWYNYLTPREAFSKARKAAHEAMTLDDNLGEAHATTGWTCVNHDWAWSCAEEAYKRALELNPGYATVHQWYAEYLSYMGRHEESIAHAERAVELDPLSIIINSDLGQVLYYAKHYDQASEQLRKALEMDPDFAISHYFLAFTCLEKQDYDGAVRAAQTALELSGGDDPLNVAQLGAVYSFSGQTDKAYAALERLGLLYPRRYVSPFCVALVHVGLKDADEAFRWLRKAHKAHDHWLETLKVHPMLESVRSDPRYEELLMQMQLT